MITWPVSETVQSSVSTNPPWLIGVDQVLYGSDWPHVAHYGRMMNVGDLLDLMAEWIPDEAARNRVFVDNAHRLYGFDAPA